MDNFSILGLGVKKLFALVAVLIILLGFFVFSTHEKTTPSTEKVSRENNLIYSRILMEHAQNIVREKKPSPTESARFYSYVSTMYYEILKSENGKGQFAATSVIELINQIYPETLTSNAVFLSNQKIEESIQPSNPSSIEVKNSLLQRERDDGFYDKKTPPRSIGTEFWIGENPLGINTVFWKFWIIEKDLTDTVPPPVKFDSDTYKEAIRIVKDAAANRTPEQESLINFWGGVPGTETPSGIWQNRLWDVTADKKWADIDYAYAQMVLAQALADSFVSCWKVKYTYWTKRPSMYDPSIDLAMPDPNFPGYVSGHSTISSTAATILDVLLPEYSTTWDTDAQNAMNSRLWAGIHFNYDNEFGFVLGKQIGQNIIKTLGLSALE